MRELTLPKPGYQDQLGVNKLLLQNGFDFSIQINATISECGKFVKYWQVGDVEPKDQGLRYPPNIILPIIYRRPKKDSNDGDNETSPSQHQEDQQQQDKPKPKPPINNLEFFKDIEID